MNEHNREQAKEHIDENPVGTSEWNFDEKSLIRLFPKLFERLLFSLLHMTHLYFILEVKSLLLDSKHEEALEKIAQRFQSAQSSSEQQSLYLLRGDIHRKYLRDYDFAMKDYDRALEHGPNSIVLNNRAILFEHNFDDLNAAYVDFTASLALKKDSIVYFNRGLLCETRLGKYAQAMEDYTESLNLNADAKVYNRRAFLSKREFCKYHEALEDYNKAIQLDSKYSSAYYNRAVLLEKVYKRYEQALQDYCKTIELDPKDKEAFNNRGMIYRDHLRDVEKAMSDFNRAIELDPSFAVARAHKSQLLFELGHTQEAKEEANLALSLDQKSSRAWYVLALVSFSDKNISQGIANLQKFLQVGHPDSTLVEKVKDLLGQWLKMLEG